MGRKSGSIGTSRMSPRSGRLLEFAALSCLLPYSMTVLRRYASYHFLLTTACLGVLSRSVWSPPGTAFLNVPVGWQSCGGDKRETLLLSINFSQLSAVQAEPGMDQPCCRADVKVLEKLGELSYQPMCREENKENYPRSVVTSYVY